MTTAEKLLQLKQDFDNVYSAGYEKGKSEGGSGMSDVFLNNARLIRFNNDDWVEGDTLEINMPNLNSLSGSFNFTFVKIKNLIITSDTPILETNDAFYQSNETGTSVLERVVFNVDFSKCKSFARWFRKHSKLKSIEGNPIDFSSGTQVGGVFSYCSYIESFRITPKSIKANISFDTNGYLDDETIQSIIDGLADLTGETARILALHTKIKARIEEDDAKEDTDETKHGWLSTITGKNWTLA